MQVDLDPQLVRQIARDSIDQAISHANILVFNLEHDQWDNMEANLKKLIATTAWIEQCRAALSKETK